MANVSKILRDERYTGKLITGTKNRITVGGRKTTPVPKSDWIVIPNAHEPIVSQETFDSVQVLLGPYNQRSITKVNINIFAGKLFCGHCRHALRRYGGLNPKYVCQSHRETQGAKCLADVIYEALLEEVVLAAVKQEVSLAFNAKRQAEKINGLLLGERDKLSVEIKRLSADVLRLKNSRESLFENYSDGKITKEQYVLMKSEQSENIELMESEIIRLSDEIYKQSQTTQHSERYERLKPFDKINEVTPEMMSLVDSIYVFDSTRIEIKFAFADGRGQV